MHSLLDDVNSCSYTSELVMPCFNNRKNSLPYFSGGGTRNSANCSARQSAITRTPLGGLADDRIPVEVYIGARLGHRALFDVPEDFAGARIQYPESGYQALSASPRFRPSCK